MHLSTPNARSDHAHAAGGQKEKEETHLPHLDDGPNKGTNKVLHIMPGGRSAGYFFYCRRTRFCQCGAAANLGQPLDGHQYRVVQSQLHACVAQSLRVVLQQPRLGSGDFQRSSDSLQPWQPHLPHPGRNAWRVDTLQYTDLKKSRAAIDSLQQAGFTIIGWDLDGNMHTMISVSSIPPMILLRQE